MSRPRIPNATRFQLFQLVHLLERMGGDAEPVGHSSSPDREVVRFRGRLSFAFPSRDVESLETVEDGAGGLLSRVTAACFGLYGVDTPLPNHYTEAMLQEDREGSDGEALRDFYDIFNHRLFSLLYRAWKKHRYYTLFDGSGDDEMSGRLIALAGFGTSGLPERAGKPGLWNAVRMARYGGLATQRPRSAMMMRSILLDFFPETQIRVRQCMLRGVRIPPTARLRLGRVRPRRDDAPGLTRRLGVDMVMGKKTYERSSRVRVVVGPLRWREFEAFLPGSSDRRTLDELVRRVAPAHVDHEVELKLVGPDVPPLRLTGKKDRSYTPMSKLGWTSWLVRRSGVDKSVVFQPRGARTEPKRTRLV